MLSWCISCYSRCAFAAGSNKLWCWIVHGSPPRLHRVWCGVDSQSLRIDQLHIVFSFNCLVLSYAFMNLCAYVLDAYQSHAMYSCLLYITVGTQCSWSIDCRRGLPRVHAQKLFRLWMISCVVVCLMLQGSCCTAQGFIL